MDTLFDEAEDPAGTPPTLTVAELSNRISQLASSTFPADLWVAGQLRNLKRSAAGHVYFDLAEPVPAGAPLRHQLAITLLEPERRHVNTTLRNAGGAVRMEDGIEVRICGRIRWYSPRGQLQFRMHGIDPSFTLGRLEEDRERLLRALAAEGLLEANASRPMPAVPLRIGLVTSRGSAAEADVRHELEASGLAFDVRFVDARTQGPECGPSVVRALEELAADDVDVILLVRGGGARSDLAAFDGEGIARAIAAMPVPVLSGIGHEIDRSVADEVSHAAHKTPTAAAAAVVARVREFLASVDATWSAIRWAARSATGAADDRLTRRRDRVARASLRQLSRHDAAMVERALRVTRGSSRALDRSEASLAVAARSLGPRALRALDRASSVIDLADARRAASDPAVALSRGWSITTTVDGRAVTSVHDVAAGTVLLTQVANGTIRSTVEQAPTGPSDRTAPSTSEMTAENQDLNP